jgi:hypothetical protein
MGCFLTRDAVHEGMPPRRKSLFAGLAVFTAITAGWVAWDFIPLGGISREHASRIASETYPHGATPFAVTSAELGRCNVVLEHGRGGERCGSQWVWLLRLDHRCYGDPTPVRVAVDYRTRSVMVLDLCGLH